MTTSLVYHIPNGKPGGISPFDLTIVKMTEDKELCIACPYLDLKYFQRMIGRATKWRLLTDLEEWLKSQSSESRLGITGFISKNRESIRHCKNLHAKLIIAEDSALIGSANFTQNGIRKKIEMSVQIENPDQIEELQAWFDSSWELSSLPKTKEIDLFAKSLPEIQISKHGSGLISKYPEINSKLSEDSAHQNKKRVEKLLEIIRLAPDRKWAESWFDLAYRLIKDANINEQDKRLSLTMPNNKKCINFIIGSRYVLTAFRNDGISTSTKKPSANNSSTCELILPYHLRTTIESLLNYISRARFFPNFKGEEKNNVPLLAKFSTPESFDNENQLATDFIEACKAELAKQSVSNFRKFHEPLIYRTIMDLRYRNKVLDRAFPTTTPKK